MTAPVAGVLVVVTPNTPTIGHLLRLGQLRRRPLWAWITGQADQRY